MAIVENVPEHVADEFHHQVEECKVEFKATMSDVVTDFKFQDVTTLKKALDKLQSDKERRLDQLWGEMWIMENEIYQLQTSVSFFIVEHSWPWDYRMTHCSETQETCSATSVPALAPSLLWREVWADPKWGKNEGFQGMNSEETMHESMEKGCLHRRQTQVQSSDGRWSVSSSCTRGRGEMNEDPCIARCNCWAQRTEGNGASK